MVAQWHRILTSSPRISGRSLARIGSEKGFARSVSPYQRSISEGSFWLHDVVLFVGLYLFLLSDGVFDLNICLFLECSTHENVLNAQAQRHLTMDHVRFSPVVTGHWENIWNLLQRRWGWPGLGQGAASTPRWHALFCNGCYHGTLVSSFRIYIYKYIYI